MYFFVIPALAGAPTTGKGLFKLNLHTFGVDVLYDLLMSCTNRRRNPMFPRFPRCSRAFQVKMSRERIMQLSKEGPFVAIATPVEH